MGECNAVGAEGALGVVPLEISALVVSLNVLLSHSNDWKFLDCSLAFPVFSIMISTSNSSAIYVD